MSSVAKKLANVSLVGRILGNLLALYLRFVWVTSRKYTEPDEGAGLVVRNAPAIVALWHGQGFLLPLIRPKELRVAVMVARNREAEVAATAIEKLGMQTVRASGALKAEDAMRKGGAAGFREMLRTLKSGSCIALTGDVPKRALETGPGIVILARHTGRPIIPISVVASRSINLRTWDRVTIPLPFSRIGLAVGAPIVVPADLAEEDIERWRETVTAGLNNVTASAYRLARQRSKFGETHG